MDIKGIKTSLIDYPDNICLTIFTAGCNYRCPFCHNGGLVLDPGKLETISIEQTLSEISKRKKMIDGITMTGGEPLLNKDIPGFLSNVKGMGLKTKVDTNGSFPGLLGEIISDGLVDYVAMDIKSSLRKYKLATGVDADTRAVKESAEILRTSGVSYEFRTTVVPGLVDERDIGEIGEWLNGSKQYYLQQFVPDSPISKSYASLKPLPAEKILEFAKKAERYFLNVGVRGI